MYLHPCASGYPDERIAEAGPPHTCVHVLRPCARACAWDWAPTHPRRHTLAARTACGSARRRSTSCRCSTRTSARGTPPQCQSWPMYVPPFRPGRRATAGGRRSAGRCARRRRRCARARVCADVWGLACAGDHVCRYRCAYERRGYVYECIYLYILCIIMTMRYHAACVRVRIDALSW
jgi:hypothetical protein